MNRNLNSLKKKIIDCGLLLWGKDLVTASNGNISLKVNDSCILITSTGTCLGFLKQEDVVLIDFEGNPIDSGMPSSEKLLHLDIYRQLINVKAVVHTHNPYTNAFFLSHDVFRPSTLEAEYALGEVASVPQSTMNVKDTQPVIDCLKKANLVVLKRHGTVAIGEDLFTCLARIQTLEDQVKTEAFRRLFSIDV